MSIMFNEICIYIYIYIYIHHTTFESTCDTLPSSAANQGDNTVSVYIYIYIYICQDETRGQYFYGV